MSKKHKSSEHKTKYTKALTYNSSEEIKEEFKTIVYKDYGEITINNLGTKVRTKTGKIPNYFLDESGYLAFNAQTSINGVRINHMPRVHRIVAEAFIPNTNNLPEVNHKDLDKMNNCVTNLEWVTTLENNRHARSHGLMKGLKGENNGRSKLTKEEVKEIREKFIGVHGQKAELAREYNVSWSLIDKIIRNENWKHV